MPEPSALVVVTSVDASGLAQVVRSGPHTWIADEPLAAGGTDRGPDPYDLLLAALGACTAMTLQLYARRKGWDLQKVQIALRHTRRYDRDCQGCEESPQRIEDIEREVTFEGQLDENQIARLHEMADRCPVHRTLMGDIKITTRLSATRSEK